ncbi:hypothetical protein [Nocardia rhizosphaerae]|uniref:RES domain-containing protein n=1 Tax=Nocardia rhizosphaerae TaxID=1691571 RepID=A0ABV8L445_9NOCA
MTVLYHGGVPGLRVGDVITPDHDRRRHDGCAQCAAGDSPGHHAVYASTSRLYATHYASLYGRGDLYRVELDNPTRSTEDSIETWHGPTARVVAVLDRAVLLTMSQRRRLYREWRDADKAVGWSTGFAARDFALARRIGLVLR